MVDAKLAKVEKASVDDLIALITDCASENTQKADAKKILKKIADVRLKPPYDDPIKEEYKPETIKF